jgi:diketogulonate reductase-like aldo/keto reductase
MWKVSDLLGLIMVPRIEYKTLKNGFSIPTYGIGTWNLGGSWQQGPHNEDSPDILAIRSAVDKRGITHIDTAELYGEGNTERLIGQALKGRDRSRLLLASKVTYTHLGYDDVINACKESLKRLMTPYLDLYIVHRYNAEFPLKETMRAMEYLKDEGLIRNIGVSNFGVEHLKEAQSYTKYPIVCDQVHYNLEVREAEHSGLLDYCQQNDIMLVAYRPLQKGMITTNPPEILKEMSEKYKKTPSQVALNWLISQQNVAVIAKTKSIVHLDENLGALGWHLSEVDIEKLRQEYPEQKIVSNAVPLG